MMKPVQTPAFSLGPATRMGTPSRSAVSNPQRDTPEQPADGRMDDLVVLNQIVEGTASATGKEFLQSLVRLLATALNVGYAFVAEFAGSPARVRTLAYWARDRIDDNIEWDLAGTPCEAVIAGRMCHHPTGVSRLFPEDRPLVQMGIESYLGVPLQNAAGKTIGHLAVFDTQPMPEEPRQLHVFRIFAARAAAELERLHMEQMLRDSEEQFRDLFDEAPIAYVYEETSTRFVSANRAFMNLLGLTPEEVPQTYGLSLVAPAPDVQGRVHESLASEQVGQQRGAIEIELRRKDNGQPLWVQRWSKPEPDGKHTRTMIVDITARVLAEREKARLQQQNIYLQEEIKSVHNFEEIIGRSPALQKLLKNIELVASTNTTVLINGETGVGKELIARAVHSASDRRNRPLIKVNCAALPTGLVESELFGHEKGAFTGAVGKRVGRFELADGGTIFLDEIGELPLDVQVKLLRVLQEREFERVGGAQTIRVDVRVIAATNRDLNQAVAGGKFRSDLFYRLNVFPILVPPLRERRDDISLLVHYFGRKFATRIGRRIDSISAESLNLLMEYPWPGNVRELENVIERAVILSQGRELTIQPETLPMGVRLTSNDQEVKRTQTSAPAAEPGSLSDVEREHILRTLRQTDWVIEGPKGAARILNLHPNTLRSRMKKHGIHKVPHESS